MVRLNLSKGLFIIIQHLNILTWEFPSRTVWICYLRVVKSYVTLLNSKSMYKNNNIHIVISSLL